MRINATIPKTWIFFDRKPVVAALLKKERRALSRSGAYVAEVARRSIYKKRRSSQPGARPHSHTGKLRQMIASGVDSNRVCAVAGALRRFDALSAGVAPRVLEHGGRSRIVNKRVGKLRLGEPGPVSLRRGKGSKKIKDFKGKTRDVVYSKLRSERQLTQARKNEEILYGKFSEYAVISPRPFMSSALIQSERAIASFFNG